MALTTPPVLQHFDHDREVIIETDASDYVSARVLSQSGDDVVLHPVAYYSKQHTPAKCNSDIYDKKLMAIIKALEEWRPEGEGAAFPFELITDHKSLGYFITKRLLNRQQAQWSELLPRFDCEMIYRPGKSKGKADAVTRRPGDLLQGGDGKLKNMEQAVLKPQNLLKQMGLWADRPAIQGRASISDLMTEENGTEPQPGKILEAIRTRNCLQAITIPECIEDDGRMRYKGNLNLPDSDKLHLRNIQEHHDTAIAGYPGQAKTFDLIDQGYYWKEMPKDVDR